MSPEQAREMITLLQDMNLLFIDLKIIGYGLFSALFLLIGLIIVNLFFLGKGND